MMICECAVQDIMTIYRANRWRGRENPPHVALSLTWRGPWRLRSQTLTSSPPAHPDAWGSWFCSPGMGIMGNFVFNNIITSKVMFMLFLSCWLLLVKKCNRKVVCGCGPFIGYPWAVQGNTGPGSTSRNWNLPGSLTVSTTILHCN